MNTGVDFAVFNILFGLVKLPLLAANICAASVAMVLSLHLNRTFVFRGAAGRRRWIAAKFLLVTLSGMYVLQNVVIYIGVGAAHSIHAVDAHAILLANMAKAAGVGACAVWNFSWYKWWVFRPQAHTAQAEAADTSA